MNDNKITCLTTLILGMLLFIGLFLSFAFSGKTEKAAPHAQLTVIAAPTLTHTPYFTPTPVSLDIHYVSEDGISVGALVVITDTGSTGLSVRPKPGTGGVLNFVASEGEQFRVIDGPDAKNDYTWWKLQSPYNEERQGWAVSEYLKVVEEK